MSGSTTAPRRRHRRRNTFIALAILVVLVVVAAIIADGIVRRVEAQTIETRIRSSLAIPTSTSVDVTVDGSSAILQYLAGKLTRVEVSISPLALDGFSGNAKLTAEGISTGGSGTVEHAKLVFSMDKEGLKKLLAGFTTVKISSVSIDSGAVKVATSASIFGLTIPISAAFVPSATSGELVLTPESFAIDGATITAAELKGKFGGIAGTLTKTQKVCVANQLPKALTLESVRVQSHSLILAVSGSSLALNGSLFDAKGTC